MQSRGLPIMNQQEDVINKFYDEKCQNIFKNYLYQGMPPISHHCNSCISHTSRKNNTQYDKNSIEFDVDAVLPSTVYDQVNPSIPNTNQFIHHPHSYPYTAIGLVIYEVAGLKRYCTGTLIDSNLVLTSTVCVYDQQCEQYTNNIWFIPAYGCINDKCRQNSSMIRVIKIHSRFNQLVQFEKKQTNYSCNINGICNQIAILQLQACLQKQYGHLGVLFDIEAYFSGEKNKNQRVDQNFMQQVQVSQGKAENGIKSGINISIVGYPINSMNKKYMYQHSCRTEQIIKIQGSKQNEEIIERQLIKYKIYSNYGHTGSPILIQNKQNNKYYIIGIHLGRQTINLNHSNKQNSSINEYKIGIRINQEIRHLINKWVKRKNGTLDISKYYKISGKILSQAQFQSICQNQLPHLKGLLLSYQKIGDKLNILLRNSWKNLTWVELWDNRIGTQGLKYLARCNWIQLSRLSLSQNLIGSEGMKNLGKAYWPNLSVLSLSSNLLDNESVNELHRSYWPNLKILTLANNRINQSSIHNLSKCSSNLKNLLWMQLHGNKQLKFELDTRNTNRQYQQIDIIEIIKNIFNKIYIYV